MVDRQEVNVLNLCSFIALIVFYRSLVIGLKISGDYKYNLWGLEDDSKEYNDAIRPCHKRAAERMLKGCLQNGGLYVKLGQGMVSMNHILPREYIETLVRLQDQALSRKPKEASLFAFFLVSFQNYDLDSQSDNYIYIRHCNIYV